jgi:hypothetical protein
MTFNIDLGSVIIAFMGFGIAVVQLNKIQKQLEIAVGNQKNDSLKIVLEIETQMNSRKLEFDKASKQIREANLQNESNDNMEILGDYFNSTKESYFNVLDRLCYCIVKDYIQDRNWRTEYRNMIKDTIDNYESDFNVASPYRNMIKINTKWQET